LAASFIAASFSLQHLQISLYFATIKSSPSSESQGAVGPFRGVGFQGIYLITLEAFEFGPAGDRHRYQPSITLRAAGYIHVNYSRSRASKTQMEPFSFIKKAVVPMGWSGTGLRNGLIFSAFYSRSSPRSFILLARRERPNAAGLSPEVTMEIVYFAAAFILLTALIYGTLHTRYQNRYQRKVSDQIVRDRYEHNIN